MCEHRKTVRDLRKARGLTQRSLATAAGVRQAMISRIEKGERTPSLDVAVSLAGALGITVECLHDSLPEKREMGT